MKNKSKQQAVKWPTNTMMTKLKKLMMMMTTKMMMNGENKQTICAIKLNLFDFHSMTIENAHVEEKAAAIEALGDIVENCT